MPIAKESGGNFTPAPEGTHLARCFAVIALGTQKSEMYADACKVMLCWELPGERITFDGKEAPMTISKEYTLSIGKKANLRRDLESWRGRAFTKEELEGFEVSSVLQTPCLLSITHKTSAKGNTYAAIQTVSKPPKGMDCPKLHHEAVIYEVESGKNDVFEKLPEWIRKKIEQCEEWCHPPIDREEAEPEPPPAPAPVPDEDDVPF